LDKLKIISGKLESIIPDTFELIGAIWWSFALSSKNRFYKYIFKIDQSNLSVEEGWGQVFYGFTKFLLFSSCKIFLNRLYRGKIVRDKLRKIHSQKIILIKSFSFDSSKFEKFNDPFFGELADHIYGKNLSPITVVEPAGNFFVYLKNNKFDHVLSVYDFLKLRDIFFVLLDLLYALLKFFRTNFSHVKGFSSGIEAYKLFLSKELFSPATTHSRLLYYSFKRCFANVRPISFIYTYENNSWERMAILAIKNSNSKIKIIAYQHNVMPPAALSMYLGAREAEVVPSPDLILTTGDVPKKLFEKFSSYPGEKILPSCALRYNYLFGMKDFPRIKTKKLLIAFEGVWPIVDILERLFLLRKEMSEWIFRIRFHPALPADVIQSKLSFNLSHVDTFEISKDIGLVKDIESCAAVLYWGSTVGLEAAMLGRPIVNIQISDINYDPLFELKEFKKTWHIDKNLRDILEAFEQLPDEDFQAQRNLAKAYIEDYFKPVTADRLDLFLR
jgi:hypothetical protein